MQPDLQTVTMIMLRSIRELYEDGEITAAPGTDVDAADFYGFRPDDVAAIHTHKTGVGDGLWFRLHDGRVYDKAGEECEPDAGLYDTTAN
jgi:hypothetical protein